jgi:hypothetical protein
LVYPIEEKHFIYRAPVSEGGGQDSTPSKGDAAGILSEFQISMQWDFWDLEEGSGLVGIGERGTSEF